MFPPVPAKASACPDKPPARGRDGVLRAEKGNNMFCGYGNNNGSCLWLIIIIILLFSCGGWGNCGCNDNNNGCGCGC